MLYVKSIFIFLKYINNSWDNFKRKPRSCHICITYIRPIWFSRQTFAVQRPLLNFLHQFVYEGLHFRSHLRNSYNLLYCVYLSPRSLLLPVKHSYLVFKYCLIFLFICVYLASCISVSDVKFSTIPFRKWNRYFIQENVSISTHGVNI